MSVHIFTTNAQPATKWRVHDSPWFECSPRKLMWCMNCRRVKCAKNLSVKAYYDTLHVFCTDKVKCETPKRKRKGRP